MNHYLSILGALFLLPAIVSGQSYPEYTTYKEKYPDEDRIHLLNERTVHLTLQGDEILVTGAVSEEELYLNNKAQYFSEETISYSTFFEVSDLKASTLIMDNGKSREYKVKDFKHKDELSSDVFHDDLRSVNFMYSSLREGAKTHLSYAEKINNPRLLSGFFFGDYFPTALSRLVIIADKRIELQFKYFNTEGFDLKMTEETKGNTKIFTWEARDVRPFKSEPNAVNFRNFIPHVIPIIASYETASGRKNLLKTPDDLYAWYWSLVNGMNADAPSQELTDIVASLVKDKANDLEKVRAIYYWVQQNIKYVAFEYALGGFVPRDANDICNKKYGDCKDNASIMHEMLKIAGLKGYLTWIGTRDIPYRYTEVPSPVSDNHMILTYREGDDYYFLDATGRYVELDIPTSFIQDKEALIAVDNEHFIIHQVPVVPGERNKISDTTRVEIRGHELIGKGNATISGYLKQDYFLSLERYDTEESLKEFYTLNFKKGSNKFLIDQFKETNKYSYDKDFNVAYTFSVGNYVVESEDEYYVNLNLSRDLIDYKIKAEDELDKEYDFMSSVEYVNILEIPDEYVLDYVPSDLSEQHDKYSASITYRQENNTLKYALRANFNFLVLEKQEFEQFNAFIKSLDKAFKEAVVLRKKEK